MPSPQPSLPLPSPSPSLIPGASPGGFMSLSSGWNLDNRLLPHLLASNRDYDGLSLSHWDGGRDRSLLGGGFREVDFVQHAAVDIFLPPVPQSGSTKIVFSSNRDGSNTQLYSMNHDGSGVTRLTNSAANDDNPRWSPNGAKILFQSDRDAPPPAGEDPGPAKKDVYVMNADGTGQTRLTTDAADDSEASWSPDGSKIVFQSLRNGLYWQVYVMNADGTNQVNLSNGAAADYQPSWSPDGTKIAFASERDHAGAPSVYLMNANGSNQTRLTFGGETVRDGQPVWSRNGLKLAFVSTRR